MLKIPGLLEGLTAIWLYSHFSVSLDSRTVGTSCWDCIHISFELKWMYMNYACASLSGLLCVHKCMRICRFVADACQRVKRFGLNLPRESNRGGRPLGSNRHSLWPRKGSSIFPRHVRKKQNSAQKTTSN